MTTAWIDDINSRIDVASKTLDRMLAGDKAQRGTSPYAIILRLKLQQVQLRARRSVH
jgi:hypothetical protein